MNNLIWLLRAKRWAERPPSLRHVIMVLTIVGIGMAIAGLQYLGWWPDWATMDQGRGVRIPR